MASSPPEWLCSVQFARTWIRHLMQDDQTTMSIAYLTPIYPMPSSTFIRREIAALEAQGFVVHRFAMRRFDGNLS